MFIKPLELSDFSVQDGAGNDFSMAQFKNVPVRTVIDPAAVGIRVQQAGSLPFFAVVVVAVWSMLLSWVLMGLRDSWCEAETNTNTTKTCCRGCCIYALLLYCFFTARTIISINE